MSGRRGRSGGQKLTPGLVDSRDPWVVWEKKKAASAAAVPPSAPVPGRMLFEDGAPDAAQACAVGSGAAAVPTVNLAAAEGQPPHKKARTHAEQKEEPRPRSHFDPKVGAVAPAAAFAARMGRAAFTAAEFRITLPDGHSADVKKKHIDPMDKWPTQAVNNMALDLCMVSVPSDFDDPAMSALVSKGKDVWSRARVSGKFYIKQSTWQRVS